MERVTLAFVLCGMCCAKYVSRMDKVVGDFADFIPPETCKTSGDEFSHRLKNDTTVTVSRRSDGVWKPESLYEGRLIINESIRLTDINMNDDGLYEFNCRCSADNTEDNVQLYVFQLQPAKSVADGGNVTVLFYYVTEGNTGTFTVQKNGTPVFELDLTSGKQTVGTHFNGSLVLSDDWKQRGNLSLTLSGVTKEDHGVYLFSVIKDSEHTEHRFAVRILGEPSEPRVTRGRSESNPNTTSPLHEHEGGSDSISKGPYYIATIVLACLLAIAILCIVWLATRGRTCGRTRGRSAHESVEYSAARQGDGSA